MPTRAATIAPPRQTSRTAVLLLERQLPGRYPAGDHAGVGDDRLDPAPLLGRGDNLEHRRFVTRIDGGRAHAVSVSTGLAGRRDAGLEVRLRGHRVGQAGIIGGPVDREDAPAVDG